MEETELIRYGDAGPDAAEESDKEAEEEKTIRRARTVWGVSACVVAGVLVAAFIVLLVLMLVYTADAEEESHDAEHQRNIHRRDIELAINRTASSGLPWYEAMYIEPQCLKPRIVRWEIKHGFRPAT